MDIVDKEINNFEDRDPSRVFLSGVGQGANMVNACFFAYKGSQPLGGIMSYLGMIPLSIQDLDTLADGEYNVLQKTPIMLAIGDKDPNLSVKNAKSSFAFYRNYVYTSAAAKALYKAYSNPSVITNLGTNLIGNKQLDTLGKKFVT